MSTWLPTNEAALEPFSSNMSTLLTATPADYGVLPADATALATFVTAFIAKRKLATEAATRSTITIAEKNGAKAALVTELRAIYKKINLANLAPEKRLELGLPVRDTKPTPAPIPTTRPQLSVLSITSGQTLVRVVDESTPTVRARPTGTDGAIVLAYIPATNEPPPSDIEKWNYKTIARRSELALSFNPEQAGKTAYLRAFWINTRGQPGPVSEPVSTTIAA